MTDREFYTPDEVAAMLRCQPEKIYRLLAAGDLPSMRFGGRRLIEKADFDAYVTHGKEAA